RRIETFRIEHGALVVVAQQHDLAIHDEIDALPGIGAIAHNVSQAVDLLDALLFDVFQDGLQGLQIAMDIADYRLHAVVLLAWPEGLRVNHPHARSLKPLADLPFRSVLANVKRCQGPGNSLPESSSGIGSRLQTSSLCLRPVGPTIGLAD